MNKDNKLIFEAFKKKATKPVTGKNIEDAFNAANIPHSSDKGSEELDIPDKEGGF